MAFDLIESVREHVQRVQRRPIPFPPATPGDVDDAERRLGFPIPALLRRLYVEIGNGGYGPGAGGRIIGVRGGHLGSAGDVVDTYADVRNGADYLGLTWPDRLLPFCDWGCAILSCVDCGDPANKVYVARECDPAGPALNFETFLRHWAEGRELLR